MISNQERSDPNDGRWLEAQEYEKFYWEKLARKIEESSVTQLDWYQWRATELEKNLAKFLNEKTKTNIKILEVGSGPIGIVNYLKFGDRYAVDSLENFYRSNRTLTKLRDPAVHYESSKGEKLAFKDKFFSLVILDNVLDHVHAPGKVLDEIRRVLSTDGLFYVAVNVHTRWGAALHTILSKLKIDKGHPYTFTPKSAGKFVNKHQFTILSKSVGDYYQARERNRKSLSIKEKIKGYTGLSEFVFSVVCSKIVK